ncbi:hypothetical protein DXC72_01820 [Bifidobacterium longum]|uniref:Saposin A-type domain-containing protein n=1 Tax=Bifidobacterium adolescentis TaxID=1680 RepID=A0AAX1TXL4_BIFAD|nr:hypothetical protein DXC74_02850 [Bifidobacterium longum]RGL24171.1 hypothetical protein DXC73_02670 [Bifidobacterium longum]RGL26720.1 hypothetical protein DXC72_01820 [Bifidobacterium longum]RGL26992.1 hypothetical protein DXC71_04930 [Bifidobacterium pseudocatenulatum]RHJ18273.1 hypothetical protein DW139_06485 [Bifidobacterium adolescentis]
MWCRSRSSAARCAALPHCAPCAGGCRIPRCDPPLRGCNSRL